VADAPQPPVQGSARRRTIRLRPKPSAVLLLALAFLGATLALRAGRDDPAARASFPVDSETVTLAPRDFVRVVRLTGLTEATRSHVVSVPLLAGSTRGSLTITRLARSGTVVVAGDLLVAFDAQNQQKLALDREVEYRDLLEQIARKQAEQDATRAKDASSLMQAEHAVRHHELEVLKNEMLSQIEAEKNLQTLDEARATLAALRDNDALKREAARAELRILEIRRDRARAAMEHASRNVAAMKIRSPLDGVVVTKQRWRGNGIGDVQEGDDLWPGAPVLEVVNQAAMRVRARINQADLPLLSPGQQVTVRFDAYPDLTLPGQLAQVAPIATPGSFSNRVRTFTTLVAIDGTNPRLLPDLTTAVDVEVERISGALVVPREAIQQANGTSRVRVLQDGGAREREVTLGASNEVEAVVMRGLEPGSVVLRRWP
jgi:HlyD family secretion protein